MNRRLLDRVLPRTVVARSADRYPRLPTMPLVAGIDRTVRNSGQLHHSAHGRNKFNSQLMLSPLVRPR